MVKVVTLANMLPRLGLLRQPGIVTDAKAS